MKSVKVGARGLFLSLSTLVSVFVRQLPHIQSPLLGLFHVARARVYLVCVFIIMIIINNKLFFLLLLIIFFVIIIITIFIIYYDYYFLLLLFLFIIIIITL